jgi:uncharacterized cupredoxin-like copper-binding protein
MSRAFRAAMAVALIGVAAVAGGCAPAAMTVTIRIHYSAFDPTEIAVPRGVPVTFVLVNEDPIDHEWLIGDDAFHERHRHGTHESHGAVPNELTVPALETVETTITFADPGPVQFICHLPGHEEYGMVGTVSVGG